MNSYQGHQGMNGTETLWQICNVSISRIVEAMYFTLLTKNTDVGLTGC